MKLVGLKIEWRRWDIPERSANVISRSSVSSHPAAFHSDISSEKFSALMPRPTLDAFFEINNVHCKLSDSSG